MSGGSEIAFTTSVPDADWNVESWSAEGDVPTFQEAFADFHPRVQKITHAVDTVHRWGINTHDPLPTWHAGNVVLIGDDGLVYNLASFMKREGDKVTFNLKLESTGGAARPQTVLALVSQAPLPALSGPNPSPAGEFFKNLKLDLARQTGKLGLGIKYFRIE